MSYGCFKDVWKRVQNPEFRLLSAASIKALKTAMRFLSNMRPVGQQVRDYLSGGENSGSNIFAIED
jgi:hypothetical protein